MGAVDLVIQVESPTSVARGLQRVGRAGHQVGAPSKGVIFPKYRGDLLEVAVVTRRMHEGAIEATAIPRNPLDVLAQQLVAMTVMDPWTVADLLETVTRATPYETLTRELLEGVLGMLAGAYPSDEFAELKPRVTWDRVTDVVEGRRDARVVAVTSGGTIPDRGLYGVFMAGEAGTPGRRVGELDEEMVYELRAGMHGDVIVLGASSWRVDEIGHDRVTVTPAPGVPGKLPFWKGDAVGRPIELGRAMGAFVGELEADLAKGEPRPNGGDHAAARAARPRRARRRQPARLSRRRARGDRRAADRQADRRRALPRRAGRLAAVPADPVRRAGPRPVVDGDRVAAARAARPRGPDHLVRRRHRDPAARGRRLARRHRGAALPRRRRGRGPGRRAGGDLVAVRQPLPRERGAGAAPAAPPARDADAALAAAPARGGPARGRVALRQLPDPRRDVPRVPQRRLRPAGAARGAGRRRAARDRRPRRRDAAGEPVREQPPVRLRRRLHVRRRRAAGRAPRRRADARPRPAPRAARPGGAARAARPRRAGRPRALAPGADRRPAGDDRRRRPRPPAPARRPVDRRGGRAGRGRRGGRRRLAGRAGVGSPGGPDPDRRRGPLDRHRGRRPLSRRRRRLGAGRRPGGVPRPGHAARSTGCSPAGPARTGRS